LLRIIAWHFTSLDAILLLLSTQVGSPPLRHLQPIQHLLLPAPLVDRVEAYLAVVGPPTSESTTDVSKGASGLRPTAWNSTMIAIGRVRRVSYMA